jgi:AP-3 complex subunit beta
MAIYCFNLARFDIDHDVRDRGRILSVLLSDISPTLKEELSGIKSSGNYDTEDDGIKRGVVTLRKQQIQMILMSGKEPAVEEADPIGELSQTDLSHVSQF